MVLLWVFGASIDEVVSVRGPGNRAVNFATEALTGEPRGCNSRKGFATEREKSMEL